jgi:DNA-binding Lrp family transcriptional regulator
VRREQGARIARVLGNPPGREDRMMDLDEFDLALIEQLRMDGRLSFESLGARVGLSRTAARARVQKIFDSGVLRVAAMVHPDIEGIRAFGHVSVAVEGAATAEVARAIAALDDAPFVSIVSGRYSIIAELRTSDVVQLSAAVGTIRGIAGTRAVDTVLYTRLLKEPHLPPQPAHADISAIDDVDRRLLGLLRVDGRMPYADLAAEVGLSPGATRARVRRLLDSGVVAVTGLVNPTAFGMTQMCGFQLNLDNDGSDALAAVQKLESVDFLARTLGRCDVIGTLITRTRADTIEALDQIRAMPGVRDIESWTHLELVKERYDHRPIGLPLAVPAY